MRVLVIGGTLFIGRNLVTALVKAGHEVTIVHRKAGHEFGRKVREIMAYRMRKKDGSTDPLSTLAWVDQQGHLTHLGSDRFTWSAGRTWKSPHTGGTYPIETTITTTDPLSGERVTFTLEPLFPDQELSGRLGGVSYWEGACRVLNDHHVEVGSAYLELTGYAGDLAERFR